jgi:MFS family permease
LDLLLGIIFDTLGRKIPLILGLFTTGISIALAPNFHEVIPGFVILRVLMTAGMLGANSPLLPDYIYPKSLGLANAYVRIF